MDRLKALQKYGNERSRYNFNDLVAAYNRGPIFKVIPGERYRDYDKGGEWVEEAPTFKEILGAMVPLSREDYRFDEGGAYNFEDKKLYSYEELEKGSKVKYKDKQYTVLDRLDYSDFDEGLFIYGLKRGDRD